MVLNKRRKKALEWKWSSYLLQLDPPRLTNSKSHLGPTFWQPKPITTFLYFFLQFSIIFSHLCHAIHTIPVIIIIIINNHHLCNEQDSLTHSAFASSIAKCHLRSFPHPTVLLIPPFPLLPPHSSIPKRTKTTPPSASSTTPPPLPTETCPSSRPCRGPPASPPRAPNPPALATLSIRNAAAVPPARTPSPTSPIRLTPPPAPPSAAMSPPRPFSWLALASRCSDTSGILLCPSRILRFQILHSPKI